MEHARCMRLHAGLPLQFWDDVVETVVYLINIEPSSALYGGIPQEEWTGKKLNYSFMRTSSCEIHIDKENRTKLESKSKKCTFIGYVVDDFG